MNDIDFVVRRICAVLFKKIELVELIAFEQCVL
jgi:hypothetical protein